MRSLTLVALLALWSAPLHAQRRSQVEQQLRESENQLNQLLELRSGLERDLVRIRGQVHTLAEEVDNLERQRMTTGRLVNELDRQLQGMSVEIERATGELILAQNALAVKRAILQQRLIEIYKRGPLHAFQALLAAESFGDLISRYKYLYLISRQDRQLATDVEQLRNSIASQRDKLVDVREQSSRRREERATELLRYQTLEQRREQRLAQRRRSEQEAIARLSQLTEEEQAVRDMIANLERERRAAEARSTGEVGAPAISVADIGRLNWPLKGDVIYRMGPEQLESGVTLNWSGIGIQAPVGTPVRAIEAGRVALAQPFGTYRITVAIDHGGGFYSLYGFLSDAVVAAGDVVREGQVLGYVGDSVDKGPRLHFELREEQVALDPLTWLTPRR